MRPPNSSGQPMQLKCAAPSVALPLHAPLEHAAQAGHAAQIAGMDRAAATPASAAASLRKRSSAGVNPSFIVVTPQNNRRGGFAQPQHAQQPLALPGGTAEQGGARARALEVQLHVVLPGVADATVQLDRTRGAIVEGIAAVALGDRGRLGQLLGALVRDTRRVPGGRLGRLDLHHHVGQAVLERLKAADRAAELHALLDVLSGHLEHLLGAAERLGGQRDARQVKAPGRARHRPHRRAPSSACSATGTFVECDLRHGPGEIEHDVRGNADARRRGGQYDDTQACAAAAAREHQQQLGAVGVDHEVARRH